ncbi:nucleotidyltransferase domain-containing protein [Nocardioides marinquilinus]|uniref:Nucleotidyltransferase domain-containing protein n=1 Tax=Nocardioides marinquilinus TaxID=1210400 RepID=A0ABP9P7R4_9ACTN
MTDSRRPLDEAVSIARGLALARHPDARAAWLGGSTASGTTTPTSDLDVTVLLDAARAGPGSVYRESLHHDGRPVELFVHVDASVRHYVAKDTWRRRPTMARLVGEGVRLLGGGADVEALEQHCRAVLDAGPPDLDAAALEARRYALTDQLDDLAGGGPGVEVAATAVAAWTAALELLLVVHGRWWGSGKWLAREAVALDADLGTDHTASLHRALAEATAPGHPNARRLIGECDDILGLVGGRRWGGYRATGEPPAATSGG